MKNAEIKNGERAIVRMNLARPIAIEGYTVSNAG